MWLLWNIKKSSSNNLTYISLLEANGGIQHVAYGKDHYCIPIDSANLAYMYMYIYFSACQLKCMMNNQRVPALTLGKTHLVDGALQSKP